MKDIMYIDVNYTCPICGRQITKAKIIKMYIRCFNKNKTDYELEFPCDCKDKIQEIIDWNDKIKEEYSDFNVLNMFANASNKAYKQALKNVGIITENEEE